MQDRRVETHSTGVPESETAALRVFVSYSRQDMAFAREIATGLEAVGNFDVSIDTEAIHEGEDWQARLGALIAAADSIVFVLTPKSAASKICQWEVEEAARLSKRILPVLAEPLGGAPAPKQLAALHYVRFDPQDDGQPRSFMENLLALKECADHRHRLAARAHAPAGARAGMAGGRARREQTSIGRRHQAGEGLAGWPAGRCAAADGIASRFHIRQ